MNQEHITGSRILPQLSPEETKKRLGGTLLFSMRKEHMTDKGNLTIYEAFRFFAWLKQR